MWLSPIFKFFRLFAICSCGALLHNFKFTINSLSLKLLILYIFIAHFLLKHKTAFHNFPIWLSLLLLFDLSRFSKAFFLSAPDLWNLSTYPKTRLPASSLRYLSSSDGKTLFMTAFLPGESGPGEHHAAKFETLHHTNSCKGKYSPKISSVKIGCGSMWGFFCHDYHLFDDRCGFHTFYEP